MASYRYYKWEIITNKGNGEIQAGDFTMYSDSRSSVKIPLSSYPYIINPLWTVNSGQEPSKLFDNQPYSKWYASTYWELYKGNGTWTNYNDLSSNQKIWIRIDTGLQNAISPKSYSWNTAEDVTGRDPISWKVYGSNDDTTWTLLSSIINYPTPDARITKVGVFDLFVIAPTNVVATIRNESAYVSWNEAQSGVQTYLVTVYSSNGYIVKTKSAINTNIIIDGLTNDNSYYFTVKIALLFPVLIFISRDIIKNNTHNISKLLKSYQLHL
jgi:hypothetical protein